MSDAFRACCSSPTFALAYIGNALALSILVLAIFAVCAFLLAMLGTVRAFGSSLACVARALFQGALAITLSLHCSSLLIVARLAFSKRLACFGSGFEIVTCIAAIALKSTI